MSDIGFSDVDDDTFSEEEAPPSFEVLAARHNAALVSREAAAKAEEGDDYQRVEASAVLDGVEENVALSERKERVAEIIRVLGNFAAERDEGRTRSDYLEVLAADLIQLYDYNEYLMNIVMEMFPPSEAVEFLEAMEKPRPMTIRVNTIKTQRRALVQLLTTRGMTVEPLERWSREGLQVFDSKVPVAGTIEYLGGYYMLQSAVSFMPVLALDPHEGEKVLDLCAAPGGKTTHIAQLMKNTGIIFANDVSDARIKALNANIQRLGVQNCIVTNYSGVGYSKVASGFDRCLLDAPCTGTGIISRDKSVKGSKSYEDTQRATQLQRDLLLSAIDCVKVGGVVVYSTCSFLIDENEMVVDYALHKRDVEVLDSGLGFGRPGYTKYRHLRLSASLTNARRYFPHVHNMDGFFVCVLRKRSAAIPLTAKEESVKRVKAARRALPTKVVPSPTEPVVKNHKVSVPPRVTIRHQPNGRKRPRSK